MRGVIQDGVAARRGQEQLCSLAVQRTVAKEGKIYVDFEENRNKI